MFKRCHILLNGKLCKYEGNLLFTRNRRPVCSIHRKLLVEHEPVQWAPKRLLDWDAANQMRDKAAALALAIMNEEYYKEVTDGL
jgi:hypothetical protein